MEILGMSPKQKKSDSTEANLTRTERLQVVVVEVLLYLQVVVVEVLLYLHRNGRLIRDGNPGRPPRLSRSSSSLRSDVKRVTRYLTPIDSRSAEVYCHKVMIWGKTQVIKWQVQKYVSALMPE